MEQGVLNHILLLLEVASEHNYAACWALMLELNVSLRGPTTKEPGLQLFLLVGVLPL